MLSTNEPEKNQLSSLQETLAKVVQQLNEHIKSQNLKVEKTIQAIHRLDQSQSKLALETGERLSTLNSKISERRSMDFKIQEMVERHNAIINSYETRLSQIQKLLIEKDAQIANLKANLNETSMNLLRIKASPKIP